MSSARSFAVAALLVTLAACSDAPATPAQTQSPAAANAPATAPPSSTPSDRPPLPQVPFPAARAMPIVEAAYTFAADHPEVLSHIPCFCGCQERGHRHNDDCFVAERDERGRVTAWEPHGIG